MRPMASRERPSAMADRTSSRFAMLFDAGTRTRTSRNGWRNGTIGRGVMGQGIMATDRMNAHWAALVLASAVVAGACVAEPPTVVGSSPSTRPSATRVVASADAPVIAFDPPHDTSQAPRYVSGRWSSSLPLLDVQLTVTPDPGFACAATFEPGHQDGAYGCDGLLPPATAMRLDLTAPPAEA